MTLTEQTTVVTDDDLEFDEADRARLRRLEQRMHALGFVRHPEHGFWVLPGTEVAAPLPRDKVEDDED